MGISGHFNDRKEEIVVTDKLTETQKALAAGKTVLFNPPSFNFVQVYKASLFRCSGVLSTFPNKQVQWDCC